MQVQNLTERGAVLKRHQHERQSLGLVALALAGSARIVVLVPEQVPRIAAAVVVVPSKVPAGFGKQEVPEELAEALPGLNIAAGR